MGSSCSSPARRRRAFLVCGTMVACLAANRGMAQRGIPVSPNIGQLGAPDEAEARQILERFRALGLDGDYYLEFELRVMPRRGEESIYSGRMWGGRRGDGEDTRVVIGSGDSEERFLVQGGDRSAVWRIAVGGEISRVDDAALLEPIRNTDLTPFDLLRPFVGWQDATFEGIVRARGRPAYRYLLRPPADFSEHFSEPASVRIYLDTAYNALVQTEELDAGGVPVKTMSVQELKKIDERWIVKVIDLRDERTGNRTRFRVTAAALGLDLADRLFIPEGLTSNAAAPAGTVPVPP